MNVPFARLLCLITLLFTTCSAFAQQRKRADMLIADFEGSSYAPWKVEGDAFGTAPAKGTLEHQMHVSGYRGQGLVNSFVGGDRTTGTLTSPPFLIERDYITFLIGGGAHAGKTCINLVHNGKIVRTATGSNSEPGGSEALEPAFWDVRELAGKTVIIQIVDQATGGWGHINVDHIMQTDTKPAVPDYARREKVFEVQARYLIMPISNGGKSAGRIQLSVAGKLVRDYGIQLATSADSTDWYAFFDISDYRGQTVKVVATRATQAGFDLVRPSDSIPGEEHFYREPHRPQFHFTQKVGWNNDPNGMVYHNGQWHLFFQHNPVSLKWGNMTWGHATSTDLLHWQQQPNVLFPKTMATGACFSGSAVVDSRNTAGFGNNALVAFLTDTGAGESLAYSTDNGRHFTWFTNNPVVHHKGRDPKVIWYAYDAHDKPLDQTAARLGGHWVMAVFDENTDAGRNIAFYTSTNLKDWTEQSHLSGFFECPELFELPVEGEPNVRKWVAFAADAKYVIGTFDGKTFRPEHMGKRQVHWGPFYASQTFNHAPDERRIQIGWLRIASPGPYNQHFSAPYELTLRTTPQGVRMFASPIKELAQLHRQVKRSGPRDLAANQSLTVSPSSDLLDVQLACTVGTATVLELRVPGKTIRYDAEAQQLNGIPLPSVDGRVRIRVLVDRSLTEIIGNDGRVVISGAGPGKSEPKPITVRAVRGSASDVSLVAYTMDSIWQAASHPASPKLK